jgi:hypothetical protein
MTSSVSEINVLIAILISGFRILVSPQHDLDQDFRFGLLVINEYTSNHFYRSRFSHSFHPKQRQRLSISRLVTMNPTRAERMFISSGQINELSGKWPIHGTALHIWRIGGSIP